MALLFPMIKLSVISSHYELYGTYFLNELQGVQRGSELTKRNKLKTQNTLYNVKGIRLTNILYYENLPQLSFGFISDKKPNTYYDIKLVDESGNEIGQLVTSGTIDFYNKTLEKLYLNLHSKLEKHQVYKVLILNKQGEFAGGMEFRYT